MPLNIQKLAISSPDIEPLAPIGKEFAADGGNTAPRLIISGVPQEARELAVIVHDPDAPLPFGFTHWTLYGIPAADQTINPQEVRVGPNGAGEHAYTGPEPPFGHGRHHYYFWVYALDCEVQGAPTRENFLQDYANHVIEQNRFVAHYER
jgi:Raf kinase inhibitor-like protein, YbhB/YbcL family